MSAIAILVAATVPAILLVLWFWTFDRDRVPAGLIWESFFLGACSGIPVVALVKLGKYVFSVGVDPVISAALEAFLEAGIPEELAKLAFIAFVARRHIDRYFPRDLVVAGAAVAGGFAALENIAYLVMSENQLSVGLIRAILSVPMHIFCGAIIGSGLALHEQSQKGMWLVLAIAAPPLLHGAFDFPLMLAKHAALLDNTPWQAIIGDQIPMAVVFAGAIASTLLFVLILRRDVGREPRPRFDEPSRWPVLTVRLEKWAWILLGLMLLACAALIFAAALETDTSRMIPIAAIFLLYACGAVYQGRARRR